MALLLHPLLTVLCLFVHHCLLCSSSADVDFVYDGFQSAGGNLRLDGSASVLDGGALRLTDDKRHITGRAFFDPPVPGRTAGGDAVVVSFSTVFVFQIVTAGRRGGDGMAFVVAASKAASPDSNHVFAVEFDTADGDNRVGVDLSSNSLVSNVSEPAAYFAGDDGRRRVSVPLESAEPIQAWVDFDGHTKTLNVTIAPVSVAMATRRPRRPLISRAVDLLPVFNNTDTYVGFSAPTGKQASSHYVLAWSFRTGTGGVAAAQSIDLSRLPRVPNPPAPPLSRSAVVKIVSLSSAATLVALVAAVVVALWLRQRAAVAETLEEWELEHPHRFAYEELYRATKGFRSSELLGGGGFGKVYRGVLHGDDVVAVKRVSSARAGGTQGVREFVAEVSSLGRLRHRNLVELRGWCKRGHDLILVYEYMPNGSLDARLFGRGGEPPLTWERRVGILRGVAAGLAYLHEEWGEQVVVHGDVKPSNVLLGADMGARLGDFGLARLCDRGGADPATTRVVGTLGYMSPEILGTGRATTATDVFAFGVLLLEVACGRRPFDPVTDVHLLRWVRELGVKGELVHAVDERLRGCYDHEGAKLVLWLGLLCSQTRPEARPHMRQVCQYLDGGKVDEEAMNVITDTNDSIDFGSLASLTWSSCATMSTGSLQDGR